MVICRAQVYSIENSALLDRLGSGPPCGSVSVSHRPAESQHGPRADHFPGPSTSSPLSPPFPHPPSLPSFFFPLIPSPSPPPPSLLFLPFPPFP